MSTPRPPFVFEARRTSMAVLLLQAVLAGAAFIVLAFLSVEQGHPAPLGFGLFIVFVVAVILWMRKREMQRSIVVSLDSQTITFKGFVFAQGFWPQPPTPELTVAFPDVLSFKVYSGRRNEILRIILTSGKLEVRRDTIADYAQLKSLIRNVVSANKAAAKKAGAQERSSVL